MTEHLPDISLTDLCVCLFVILISNTMKFSLKKFKLRFKFLK